MKPICFLTITLLLHLFYSFPVFGQEYVPDSNTVALYHFNETSGSVVADTSGNGNHGTAIGTTIVDGRFGKARDLSDGVIQIANTPTLNFGSGSFTLEAWVKTTNTDYARFLLKRSSIGYELSIYWDGIPFIDISDGGGAPHTVGVSATSVVNDGLWYHLAGVRDGGTLKIYVNGVLQGTADASFVGSLDFAVDLLLGDADSTIIDEVRLSKVARSPNEFNVSAVEDYNLPKEYTVAQNFPNPFNPSTTIEYQLPNRSTVEITIYNALGQIVRTLQNEQKEVGHYSILWDGRSDFGSLLSSGTYFYQFKADGLMQMRKMILLK